MEVTIKTEFSPGDRVWKPDGKGGREKGRVRRAMIMRTEVTGKEAPRTGAITYECEDIEGNLYWYQEWQLTRRK